MTELEISRIQDMIKVAMGPVAIDVAEIKASLFERCETREKWIQKIEDRQGEQQKQMDGMNKRIWMAGGVIGILATAGTWIVEYFAAGKGH
ncbi:MAG: hypothetical protein HQK81_12370 [Desulfovibrionaceae bacterium]|nr:hypothetical protein [Desulfovibrionaceae bacterium]MBF0514838.1 hypothetical protein [Desulfovibrionaceae bacterium]